MTVNTKNGKKYLVFTVSDTEDMNDVTVPGFFVLKHRLSNNIWGFHSRTRCRKYVSDGEKVLFYVTGNNDHSKCFVAEAEIDGAPQGFSAYDNKLYGKENGWYYQPPAYKIKLKKIKWFKKPVNILDIKARMDMFKASKTNKWGVFLQGGAFRISKKDLALIKGKSK